MKYQNVSPQKNLYRLLASLFFVPLYKEFKFSWCKVRAKPDISAFIIIVQGDRIIECQNRNLNRYKVVERKGARLKALTLKDIRNICRMIRLSPEYLGFAKNLPSLETRVVDDFGDMEAREYQLKKKAESLH